MRIGIVVDSTCDLPDAYFRENDLIVLPIRVIIEQDTLTDERDEAVRQRFFDEGFGTRSHGAETEPYSVEQVRQLFLGQLVIDYDCVFCLTVTSSRSLVYANTSEAAFGILTAYRPIRQRAGVTGPFLMRVIDSENLFSAQGITAVEAVRMRAQGVPPGTMRERLEYLSKHTYGYVVPRDLHYMRARTQKRGDRSLNWFTATVATALDIKPILRCWQGQTGPVGKVRGFEDAVESLLRYAIGRIRMGLLTPTFCLSYGGNFEDINGLRAYAELHEACVQHGVQLFESPMSVTGMVNLGVGAFSIGFAAEDHAFAL